MPILNRILVPIDFSDGSRQALQLALDLARDAGATVEALHVIETPYLTGGELELGPAADLTSWAEGEARAFVDRHLRPGRDGVPPAVVVHVTTGSPAREILRFLNDRPDIDLVTLATHGRGGMSRFLLGSVADKLVRGAPCPVLTIRAPESR